MTRCWHESCSNALCAVSYRNDLGHSLCHHSPPPLEMFPVVPISVPVCLCACVTAAGRTKPRCGDRRRDKMYG